MAISEATETAARPALRLASEAAIRPLPRVTTQRNWVKLRLLVDAVMLVTAAVMAEVSTFLAGAERVDPLWVLALPLLTVFLLGRRGAYRNRIRLELAEDLRLIVATTSVSAMAIVTAGVVVGGDTSTASAVLHQWLFSIVYLAAGHAGLSIALSRARRNRSVAVPTLIIGAGAVGRLVARRLQERPELGLEPIGYLDTQPRPTTTPTDDLPVLDSWDVNTAVNEMGIGQVLVAFSTAPSSAELDIVRDCNRAGIPVALVPRLFEAVPADVEVEHIGGLPLVSLRPSNPRSWRVTLKYTVDPIVAAFALLLVWPLLAAAAVAVWVSLGRPIFFRQTRVGVDGGTFAMLKFRTMRAGPVPDDAVELGDDTAPGGVEGDDRRTRVGKLLRRTSLDELPQLFNVLGGQMSIVGPRPERPEFVRRFEESVPRYAERHRVKAGITGWAQIAGLRGQTSLQDRVEWDNWYIESWTPWLDLRIVFMTLAAVVRADGTE